MTDLSCAEARDLVAEYALGLLEPPLAHQMSRHVIGCIACRREVDEIGAIGDQLLDLIPDAEPPLGFDRAVIASIGQRSKPRGHRRLLAGAAALAAAVAATVGLSVANLSGGRHQPQRAELTAVLREGSRPVGTVYVGGNPAWITMSVDHVALTGTVTCQLVARDGSSITVGDFQLVDGSGKWSAPEAVATSELVGARLVAPDGTVMATATFSAI